MCGKYENINYIIVTKDPVYNSILSLYLGRGTVNLVKMVSLIRMVSYAGHSGKVHLDLNASSSTHNCGCVVGRWR